MVDELLSREALVVTLSLTGIGLALIFFGLLRQRRRVVRRRRRGAERRRQQ